MAEQRLGSPASSSWWYPDHSSSIATLLFFFFFPLAPTALGDYTLIVSINGLLRSNETSLVNCCTSLAHILFAILHWPLLKKHGREEEKGMLKQSSSQSFGFLCCHTQPEKYIHLGKFCVISQALRALYRWWLHQWIYVF